MQIQNYKIETVKSDDFESLYELIKIFSDKFEMLPKTMDELYHSAQSFRVIKEKDQVVACAHLDIFTPELAEVKTLAVSETLQGKGLGRLLVLDCINQARQLGIKKLFALTFKDVFFQKLGFDVVTMDSLPEKVYKECVRCKYYGNCKEVAVLKNL